MSDRAQDVLHRVLWDDLRACPERDALLAAPCLQEAWTGALDYELEIWLWWWFVDRFMTDAEERARVYRVSDGIRRVFLNIARLHYAQTGEATLLPERLIRALQMAAVTEMHPSAYGVATSATTGPVASTSTKLARLTGETEWLTRS